ncbi:MAG: MATE family efflux transporter [Beutenbergiaceae bacterium]
MDDTPRQHASGDARGPTPSRASRRQLDRRIFALAWPAFGALIAEPLFVLIDSAVVGHLGTAELAALTLASAVLLTLVAVFVFLAYATTAAVARKLGADDERGALAVGMDGVWLALLLGVLLAATGLTFAHPLVTALGASGEVIPHAVAYLRASAPGIPGMLVVLAATGALRGLQDTRTPFVVAVAGAIVNAAASIGLVYGAGMGIAGSGLATALTQIAMAVALGWRLVRGARQRGVSLRPHPTGILANARAGVPLLIRTLTLRAAILVTVLVATRLGDVPLAAHQIVNSIWGLVAFALDALAIAAQALVGRGLGARDGDGVRALTRRSLWWGTWAGAGIGVLVAVSGPVVAPLFSSDPAVHRAAALGLLVCGLAMPIAGWVFVLDGVLIGAGDGRFLAWAGLVTLLAYLPLAWAVARWAPPGAIGLAWLWLAFGGGFMLARAITTGLRARGSRWMVLGADSAR